MSEQFQVKQLLTSAVFPFSEKIIIHFIGTGSTITEKLSQTVQYNCSKCLNIYKVVGQFDYVFKAKLTKIFFFFSFFSLGQNIPLE